MQEVISLSEFRTNPLFSVNPQCPVMQAQDLAKNQGFHHFPVIQDGKLVGVICTCDMLHAPSDTTVEKLMHPPLTLSVNHTTEDALQLMRECLVGSVVIVERDEAVGIITRADLGAPYSKDENDPIPRCNHCGTSSHLRPSREDGILCVNCLGRVGSEMELALVGE